MAFAAPGPILASETSREGAELGPVSVAGTPRGVNSGLASLCSIQAGP